MFDVSFIRIWDITDVHLENGISLPSRARNAVILLVVTNLASTFVVVAVARAGSKSRERESSDVIHTRRV